MLYQCFSLVQAVAVVYQHYRQKDSVFQVIQLYAGGSWEGYSHQKPTKEEHEDKVSRASPEGAFLQHSTVSVSESTWLRQPTQNHQHGPIIQFMSWAELLIFTIVLIV